MDEEQPKKKITLNNFFESIQSADGKANRALKKSSSNLDLINKNKSLIEGLLKSVKDIKSKVESIQKSISDKKDIEEDKLFVQEDQEQKIRRLERLQGIEGDKVDPADDAAGTTDDSEFEKKASETVKKALQDPKYFINFYWTYRIKCRWSYGCWWKSAIGKRLKQRNI